jgi:hypothetical protein
MIERDELRHDPVLGSLVRDLETTESRLREAQEALRAHENRLTGQEDAIIRGGYLAQLDALEAHHRRKYGRKLDRDALIGFALERRVADLSIAYRAYSADDATALAAKEAEARGVARGRREAGGGRGRGTWNAPQITRPVLGGREFSSIQDLPDDGDAFLADPDIRAALSGEDE